MDGTRMAVKRMEVRVAYMESLYDAGNDRELAQVALTLDTLDAWFARFHDEIDAVVAVVLRHVRVMPLCPGDRRAASRLCLDLFQALPSSSMNLLSSSVEVLLHVLEYDLKALLNALFGRFGSSLEGDNDQLLLFLRILNQVIQHARSGSELEEILYTSFRSADSAMIGIEHIADVVNLALECPTAALRVEALRTLRSVAVQVSIEAGFRVCGVLVDAAVDETEANIAAFALANLWELLFLRPALAMRVFSSELSESFMSSFHDEKLMLRRVSIHGAIRLLLHSRKPHVFDVTMLCALLDIYTSDREQDEHCLRMLFSLFEEQLGDSYVHQTITKAAVLKLNRDAYLSGIPLPTSHEMCSQSQLFSQVSAPEAKLKRQNKLLTKLLNASSKDSLWSEMQRMMSTEFGSVFSIERIKRIVERGA
ncbi:hypothetical protein Poli38472_009736 [Pythium oligandrum]|uniref:Uncharacterized protein n=1 Tax=Pythium oligandrum TaxID=41045 RepID=A0A8K1CGT6_PYTOL|nr:hypothetical protein Poli38472_009736 [Pythium oligandrum]|eukprot:TMW62243.1 hypothetical protein Poli38472_009736 [Pythium oligandrum]